MSSQNNDLEHKFIKELYEFFVFLDNITNSPQLKNILKNFTHLNFKKISTYTFKETSTFKADIFKHNSELFMVPQVFFPTLDISPIYNEMTPEQINTFWEKFVRIYVFCQCLNTNESEENLSLMDKLVNEYKQEQNEIHNNPFNSFLNLFIDGDALNKKIQEAEISEYTEFTDKIGEVLPSANDPTFKAQLNNIIKDIFVDLKTIDFRKNDLYTVIQSLGKKFADKLQTDIDPNTMQHIMGIISDFITSMKSDDALEQLTKTADPETKKLVNMTSNFVKNVDLKNQDLTTIMQNFNNFAVDNLPEIMKKKGLNDKRVQDVMNNPKNYGIDSTQLTSNNRKMKRAAARMNKK